MDLLSSPVAPYRRMEHLVHRQQELIAELVGPHELAGVNELAEDLEATRVRLAQAASDLAHSQAELAQTRARLARVAWRERIHNKIARLARSIRRR